MGIIMNPFAVVTQNLVDSSHPKIPIAPHLAKIGYWVPQKYGTEQLVTPLLRHTIQVGRITINNYPWVKKTTLKYTCV